MTQLVQIALAEDIESSMEAGQHAIESMTDPDELISDA
jgi:hypothetical protein